MLQALFNVVSKFPVLLAFYLLVQPFSMPFMQIWAHEDPDTEYPHDPVTVDLSDGKPTWKVAWVVVPQVIVKVENQERTVNYPAEWKTFFFDAAERFENYVEEHSNYAVDVQITTITIEETPEFISAHKKRISLRPRIAEELQKLGVEDKYTLEEYDSWMVGWPFHLSTANGKTDYTNANYHLDNGLTGGRLLNGTAYRGSREAYINASNDKSVETMFRTIIHEFLHLSEYWFLDNLKYPLPYRLKDDSALHNLKHFGYDDSKAADGGRKFYENWLSYSIADPKASGKMLGIPPEAWQSTPTKGVAIKIEQKDESVTVICHIPYGEILEEFNLPSSDTAFDGWSFDSDRITTVSLPMIVDRHITMYPKWKDVSYNHTAVLDISGKWYIDLRTETLHSPWSIPIEACAANGKWKKGIPNIAKILNKASNLQLAAKYNNKTKTPIGEVIAFPAIQGRPKTEKLKPCYNADTWTAKTKAGAAPEGNYECAEIISKNVPVDELATSTDILEFDKKNYVTDWRTNAGKEFAIQLGREKKTYLFRTAPVTDINTGTYIPAGKAFKVKPKNFGKKPSFVLNKGNLSLKKGYTYVIGEEIPISLTAKAKLTISDLPEEMGKITIWKTETGKKPRSEKQEIALR
ncbi:MAG: hypothetical protein FWH04_05660 [Oscillospiraceae bacterium]|nr:hypothetical protein [Oscillospiraceae bacterium]